VYVVRRVCVVCVCCEECAYVVHRGVCGVCYFVCRVYDVCVKSVCMM